MPEGTSRSASRLPSRSPSPAPSRPDAEGEPAASGVSGASREPRTATSSPARAVSRAGAPPRRWGLRDLQLEARRRSPDAERWAARVEAAAARHRGARSGYWPRLVTEGRYLRLDEEVAFEDPLGNRFVVEDREAHTQTTTLSWNVLDWGETRLRVKAGLDERRREEERRRRGLQDLDLAVARAYYSLLEARQEADVLRASADTLEGALELARRTREVGRSTRADVLVVEVDLARTRFRLRRSEDRARDFEDRLAEALDLPSGTRFEPRGGVDPSEEIPRFESQDGDLDPSQSAAWTRVALSRRAEVQSLRLAREALESSRRALERTYLPRIDLFVQHEYSTTASAFRDPEFFSGGVSARWELFSGFRTRERIRELGARAREVEARERAVRSEIANRVRRALRSLRRSRDGVAVARRGIELAGENLRRVTERFRNGRASGQELLEAENLLRAERGREVEARSLVSRGYAELRHACGLDPAEDPRPGHGRLREPGAGGERARD